MKKIVFLLFSVVLLSTLLNNNKELIIPSNAIRVRIIADNNDVGEQKIKSDVKNEVISYLGFLLENTDNYDKAHNIIENNINYVDKIVRKYKDEFTINYGKNYFPKKEYKGVKFPEGYYDSLVIELGSGKGNNFWCVMFPPLCLIEEDKTSPADYQFYILNLLKNIK